MSRSVALSVNLNKVALLRNSRPLDVPNVMHAARLALEAGAHGITVHPRPDARHIRPSDVIELATFLTNHKDKEFNIEGNPFSTADTSGADSTYPGFIELVESAARIGAVDQVTLVPDDPGQSTSDHGWNLENDGSRLAPIVERFQNMGCRVSLFMDPDPEAMILAARTGADRVELYTEPYARAFEAGDPQAFRDYHDSAIAARDAGLDLNAGHDLNLDNLGPFIEAVPGISEVSIGHALTADALWMGYPAAVAAYLHLLNH